MTPIYHTTTGYRLNKPWICATFRASMRSIRTLGQEQLPTDGAIILAPNHTNGLLDAMVLLSLQQHRLIYVARADIFRKPKQARALRWLGMLPIKRMRDGIDQVRQNDDTFDEAVETLRRQVPFVIMPEGTHRPKHSLLPLNKGIFRIALQALPQMNGKPLYIVPIGIDYSDYYRLYSDVLVQYGKPICVQTFIAEHPGLTQAELLNVFRDDLTQRIQGLIRWVPDDEQYDQHWAQLQADIDAADAQSSLAIYKQLQPKANKPMVAILLALTAPIMAACAVVSWPIQLAKIILPKIIKDPVFPNSFLFAIQLVLTPLSLGTLPLFTRIVDEWFHWLRLCCRN